MAFTDISQRRKDEVARSVLGIHVPSRAAACDRRAQATSMFEPVRARFSSVTGDSKKRRLFGVRIALFHLHFQPGSMSMYRNRLAAGITFCALALVMTPTTAEAQVKPFNIVGGGFAPMGLPLPGQPGRPHWAVGIGTELGFYCGEGEVETDTADFLPDGTVVGEFGSPVPFVFTASNGDKLACYYGRTDFGAQNPGTFELTPVPKLGPGWYTAEFIAEFVPFGPECTGKFKGVTGSWIMIANTAPFLLGSSDSTFYVWEGQGSLTFKKGH
jgi:hypothetical protein